MPRPKPTLSVVPNRYLALDEDGDPAAFVQRVDLRALLVGAKRRPNPGGSAPKIAYDDEPTDLPDLPAYRNMLRTGELLPADERTAAAVGLKFVEPALALARSGERAATAFLREHSELPAWAADLPAFRDLVAAGKAGAEAIADLAASAESAAEPAPTQGA